MCRNYLVALVLLLFILGSVIAQAAQKGHDFKGQCERCHLTTPGVGEPIFASAIDTLCRECHKLNKQNAHPSEVTPSMSMQKSFWLDAEGRLNCATCHDPHPEQAETYPWLLRSKQAGVAFCQLCHDQTVSATGQHLAATILAHGKSYTPPTGSSAEMDQLSTDCVSCHDGSEAPHASFCLLGQEGQCSGHIIGLDYDRVAAGNQGLNPRSSISPLLSFYQGKVGCASCHSIYSGEATKLVVGSRESPLCLQCHRK